MAVCRLDTLLCIRLQKCATCQLATVKLTVQFTSVYLFHHKHYKSIIYTSLQQQQDFIQLPCIHMYQKDLYDIE